MDTFLETLSLEDARTVATPFTRYTGKEQANTLCELSLTDKAIYMSGSSLSQFIALDRMDVVLDRLVHGCRVGWRRDNTIADDSWNVDGCGSLV